MKKFYYEELEAVNGGVIEKKGGPSECGAILVYSKDGVSIMMSPGDYNWFVSQYGIDFAMRMSGEEIERIIFGRHMMQGIK